MNVNLKSEKIAVFGPHDRMNYGDFLFPLMLDFAFSKLTQQDVQFNKYSLVSSDFTEIGAFKSKNYRQLKKDINHGKVNVLIVAGGESLQAKWDNLYSYINPIYDYFYKKTRIRKNRIFRNIPKFLLGGTTENPFLIHKKDFKKNIKVIYNAVGNGHNLSSNQIKRVKDSDLCALREKKSYQFVWDKFNSALLVPDSAIILSDVFPFDKTMPKLVENDYIFFQISNHKHQNQLDKVCKQLTDIANTSNCKIILCPIGTAKGHEDHIALKQILKNTHHPNITLFKETPTINEIISLITHSKMYIGTSLHGVITSMSYGIPYIALNPQQIKLNSYLETWGIEELDTVSEISNFSVEFNRIFRDVSLNEKILEKTKEQKAIYYNFIETMIETINS